MRERRIYLDAVRFFAIICVILNHVDITYYYYHDTTNAITFFVSYVLSVLCVVNVPLFFMISGATLSKQEESIGVILKKRVYRIAIVLLIFSCFDYILKVMRGNNTTFGPGDFIKQLLTGSIEEPYWFLYAYLGLLVILPFLRKITAGIEDRLEAAPKEFLLLLALQFFCSVLFPVIKSIMGVSITENLALSWFVIIDPIFFFLCGSYLSSPEMDKWLKKNQIRNLLLVAGVALLLLPSGYALYRFLINGEVSETYMGMPRAFLTLIIFAYFRSILDYRSISETLSAKLIFIGQHTFGIYLTEIYARIVLLPVYVLLTQETVGLIAAPVYVILTFLLAMVLSIVMKKIPGLRRLL